MRLIIQASTLDAPAQITDSGARNFVEFFPLAVDNLFRIMNPPEGIARLAPAKFESESNIIITRAMIEFPGAPGIRPSPAPADFSPCDVIFQAGSEKINFSFTQFEIWQPVNRLITNDKAVAGIFKFLWDGAAPIGRCKLIYDGLNIQPVYYLQDFSATLSLELEIVGDIIP
jgi:hypothetical protein